MRIISGKHRGRQIQAPRTLPVRPTTDQAKEGLFNILSHRIDLEEIAVLDCFSGTGNMAYEFLSRGAAMVTCIDIHTKCIHFIKDTARLLKEEEKVKALKMPVEKFLGKTEEKFDIIFMDPPYALVGKAALVNLVFKRTLLEPEGMLILEHGSHETFSDLPGFQESRAYGSSTFSFFS